MPEEGDEEMTTRQRNGLRQRALGHDPGRPGYVPLGLLLLTVTMGMMSVFLSGCTSLPSKIPSPLPDPRHLQYRPLELHLPKVERKKLKNNMVLYLLPDHEIPIINISVLIRTGSIYEPSDKIGLGELTGEVMRTGGTASLSPAELDEELEFHSIHVSTSIGRDSGQASLSVLTKDVDRGMELFFDVLRNPAFQLDKVDLAKQKKTEEIRRKNDSPQNIAFREFRKILYKGDPRGNEAHIEDIQKLTREDMIWFHGRYFHPDNLILGISGDFLKEEIIEKLEKLTAGWEPLPKPVPQPPVPRGPASKTVNFISKQIPQSIILMGGMAPAKSHPDYFAFSVLNDILGGGGFNSYLAEEIRSDRGLAYSVGSFHTGYKDYGVFGAYCFTGSSHTHLVTSLMYQILNRVKLGQITSEKLQWAKDSILNQFVFSFSSSDGLVGQLMSLEYHDLPRDYLDTFQENIRKVSLADVQRVAGNYLEPEKYILLVLGNDDHFDQSLTQFGPINVINIENY
ncbi:MAG: M16 family metallopeptidase [bacterium]